MLISYIFIHVYACRDLQTQTKTHMYRTGTSIRQVPEFGTLKHYGKAHGISSGWMICNDSILLAYYNQQSFHIITIILLKEVWK